MADTPRETYQAQPDPADATLACYDVIAAQYTARSVARGPLTSLVWAMVESAGLLTPGARVLDAGCGPGLDVAALTARGILATGVEPSSGMLAQAALAAPGLVHPGSLNDLGVPAASFDVAVSAAALHHLPADAQRDAIGQLARAARPGGAVAVSTEHGQGGRWEETPWGGRRYYQPATEGELVAMFEAAGLRVAQTMLKRTHRDWVAILGYRER